jgi:hypothetical protein
MQPIKLVSFIKNRVDIRFADGSVESHKSGTPQYEAWQSRVRSENPGLFFVEQPYRSVVGRSPFYRNY